MSENGITITTPDIKITPFSPNGQPQPHNTSNSGQRRRRAAAATKSRGFCRRLGDCIVMGPASTRYVDLNQRAINLDKLSLQVKSL